jgi:uncharacterized protein with NAD-binding domain and iron-sulfur cluster
VRGRNNPGHIACFSLRQRRPIAARLSIAVTEAVVTAGDHEAGRSSLSSGSTIDVNLPMLDVRLNGCRGGALSEQKPIRVAVIGGGCASISAAFELTRPEHKGKYEVTIYQVGWRLGGKGASGRGPAVRIEEHGFHVWMGFYENAFRLMRECYAELDRDPGKCRIANWRDAFFPSPFIGMASRSQEGSYSTWLSYFPSAEGLPGDPPTKEHPFSVPSYLAHTAAALRTMLLAAETSVSRARNGGLGKDGGAQDESHAAPRIATLPDDLTTRIARLLKFGLLATTAGIIEGLGLLQALFERSAIYPSILLPLLEAMSTTARRQIEPLLSNDPELGLLWQAIDLGMTSMVGIIRFGLFSDPRGFDAINDYDFREWMKLNGASESTINSPLVRSSYDLAMAYESGDYQKARHAAGVALRGSLRFLFTYRGSIVWKMRAGMGDTVFAPFYEVLKRRGVSFRFFHRLESVKLAEPGDLLPGEAPYVKALRFAIQAEVRDDEYHPLVNVDGLPCWPSTPDYSQLVDGEGLKDWKFESHWDQRAVGTKTLHVVQDFDVVVLGVGLGAIPFVCQDLLERDERWRNMVANVKTVETQAFQIWMREDMESLGWTGPPISMCGFARPFDTWGDMRHLIPEEKWPSPPSAIAYFCSALADSEIAPEAIGGDYEAMRREQVRKNAIGFLNSEIGQLWPRAIGSPGKFKWDLLVSVNGTYSREGESRFDSQFWTANVNPSDRYVLSLPGTPKYRISPLDCTYDNMTIAGDWTACGLDTGCVESAVISGRLAAHAISGYPALREIVGYDHP